MEYYRPSHGVKMKPDGEYYALYPYGFIVYGTAQPDFDYDFLRIKEGARLALCWQKRL